MEIVEVTFDLERSRKIFKKYFEFEKKRGFKKVPVFLTIGVGLFLFLLGSNYRINIVASLGLFMMVSLIGYLAYSNLKFQWAIDKFLKELEERDIESERHFKFCFDSEIILHESQNSSSKVKWDLIKNYNENQNDIYLYLEHHKLYDIISESILGEESFKKFKTITKEKFKNLPKVN